MPAAQLDFRATCGTFLPVFMTFMRKRASVQAAMRTRVLTARTRVQGVLIGTLLVLLFWGSLLYQAGDIETNPGPATGGKKDTTKQTRLTSTSRRESVDPSAAPPVTSPTLDNPSLTDVASLIHNMTMSMNSNFEDVRKDVGQLKDVCQGIEKCVSALKEDVEKLKEENVNLRRENEILCERMEKLERKTDDLEGRSRRKNLIFYGISRERNETRENLEMTVREMFVDKLELSQEVPFDRLHRLNNKTDSPIIGCCTNYKDKELVLRNRKKLQGSNIFISEDFTVRVREIRKKLVPFMKEARKANKMVSMVYDHLIIEGRKYFLEGDSLKVRG